MAIALLAIANFAMLNVMAGEKINKEGMPEQSIEEIVVES